MTTPTKFNPVLGYRMVFEPIVQPKGYVYTRAFILCAQCKAPISSHGGPCYHSLCIPCFEAMNNDLSM